MTEEVKEKLESMIATVMAQACIPGLSIAVVKDSQVVYARGFGARNVKENLPATPNTLFGIGSCTKSFTALAIMQLAEKGKLDIHDPVSKYVPFKLGSREEPITIHHLLTHSSGIPDLGVAEVLISRMAGIDEKWVPLASLEDFLLHINGASKEVAAEPGKRFFYFNSGYTLLGEIIERVAETPYEEYVRENILKPLKMERSTFLKEEFEKDPDVMTPYLVETKNGTVTVTPSRHPFHKFIYAPGGLLSSVMELS
ncbi:serine hydrolase, partial [Candidatus Bathyarchaeota archaeon]